MWQSYSHATLELFLDNFGALIPENLILYVQEIDLATGTLSSIQTGSRKLLGKANPVYAMQLHDGMIYSGSSPLDGAAVKVPHKNCISILTF